MANDQGSATELDSPGTRDINIHDDALSGMAEMLMGEEAATEEVTETNEEQVTEDATEEETTVDDSGNEESEDTGGDDDGGAEGDVDVEVEKPSDDGVNYYTDEELANTPTNQLDPKRVPEYAKRWFDGAKEHHRAADEKFRAGAEERKRTAAEKSEIERLIETMNQQIRLQVEEREHNRTTQQVREREQRYQRIAEEQGEFAAQQAREFDKFKDSQAANQSGSSEVAELKQRLEELQHKQLMNDIERDLRTSMESAGLDFGDKNMFEEVHREAFAQWNLDNTNGKQMTHPDEIAKRVKARRDSLVSEDALMQRIQSNPKLLEEIEKRAVQKFIENSGKKKAKTVPPTGGGEAEIKAKEEELPDRIDDPADCMPDSMIDNIVGQISGRGVTK